MNHVALIRMTWPQTALWQNSRVHWTKRRAAVKAYRYEAFALAKQQTVSRLKTETPRLLLTFHPPDRRKRDLHNMPATQKAAIDGIADAMGCDDEGFRVSWPETWGEVVKGGCVLIEVTE